MPESDLPARLASFGLTKQEAEVFVLLNRVRNAGTEGLTGRSAAELTQFGRVRTYQILQRLVKLGLVDVRPGRPKSYSSVTPQVGIRRLVALQESRLTDLSLKEAEVSERLSNVPPIRTERSGEGKERRSAMVLHGVSNIQAWARRAMEGKDLKIVVNEDSEDHVTTTLRYMTEKPKSARIIFAAKNGAQKGLTSDQLEIGGYTYNGRVFQGELPTFVLADEQCLFFTYATERRRRGPLSPMSAMAFVSECIVVEDPKFVAQMGNVYERFWAESEQGE